MLNVTILCYHRKLYLIISIIHHPLKPKSVYVFIFCDVRLKLSALVYPPKSVICRLLKNRLSDKISYPCIHYCPGATRCWPTRWAYSLLSRSHVFFPPYWSITGLVPRCRRSKLKCKYIGECPDLILGRKSGASSPFCTMVMLIDGFVFRKNLPEYGVSKKINDLGHITFNLDTDILFKFV